MTSPLRAILFDLDGTLLPHRFEDFLPRYLGRVRERFATLLQGGDVVRSLLAATQVMLANDGRRTNEEVFWEEFSARVKHPRHELDPMFLRFYEEEFPTLRGDIGLDPAAAAVVAECRAMGLQVILATNPVFPRVALEERARWAGVNPSWFDLITSFEHMRACKPRRAYYRQIADELGVAPEACLMVGNDMALDLAPAAAVGMRTCLVESAFEVGMTGFEPEVRCALAAVPDVVKRAA